MGDKTVDQWVKASKELIKDSSEKISEAAEHGVRLLPYWIAGALTALVATFYAKLFLWAEELASELYQSQGLWMLLVTPLAFILSWYVVEKFAPTAGGSGIPQLRFCVEACGRGQESIVDRFLGLRVVFIKIISSILAVLGGGAIGREGPTLQIAGAIFRFVGRFWPSENELAKQNFLLAGAASGLASAFNTPLGGIVYAIEELAKSHLSKFRTGVIHSVIVAGIISQLIMGSYLYFGYPKTGIFRYQVVVEIILISLIAAAVVTGFSETLKRVVQFRSSLRSILHRLWFAAGMGFLFAASVLWLSEDTLGPGRALLDRLLFDGHEAGFREVLGRFFGTSLTYASGGAGGVFAPTLSLGGSIASLVDSFANLQLGPLAVLVGMTAGLAALTHSPLTSFILMLEMTDRHSAIFPLMIAAVLGHGFSKLIVRQSFYDFVLHRLFVAEEESEKAQSQPSNSQPRHPKD